VSPNADEPSESPHASRSESQHLPELADKTGAGTQERGESAERLVPVPLDQARDALRPPEPEDLNEALVSLIRNEAIRSVVLAYLRDNGERYDQAIRRGDDLQERLLIEQRESQERLAREKLDCKENLGREQQAHAVTKRDLTHASTRTTGQTLLQLLGGGFFAWGLTEIGKSWAAAVYIGIGLVMIVIGCLPIITIPWWRRTGE
jgi:hypothetical protein